eukprot:CAMPEP_0206149156 /NCGR_PEP_ID=MMETSP1473-20131121/37632_1 /ASSEMBLY_ACC=CAM_ASM_001109 /TAXON_ID=1461547 /ORGANISM="Stichococcus sp, Strain RCC1054" /LENGTH=194 /DNA_ID=CAMNT_0053546605 /DNA_START=142 /DNA_END=726 /DNA_ORIENTATION=-
MIVINELMRRASSSESETPLGKLSDLSQTCLSISCAFLRASNSSQWEFLNVRNPLFQDISYASDASIGAAELRQRQGLCAAPPKLPGVSDAPFSRTCLTPMQPHTVALRTTYSTTKSATPAPIRMAGLMPPPGASLCSSALRALRVAVELAFRLTGSWYAMKRRLGALQTGHLYPSTADAAAKLASIYPQSLQM